MGNNNSTELEDPSHDRRPSVCKSDSEDSTSDYHSVKDICENNSEGSEEEDDSEGSEEEDDSEGSEEEEDEERWDEIIIQWIKIFKIHRPRLEENIKELENIAEEMRKTSWDVAVAQTTGSSAGLAGGALGLTGLVLAPFTLGTSAIVGFVGIGVGVAGAATHIGSGVTKTVMFNNRIEKAGTVTEVINKSLTEINRVHEDLMEIFRYVGEKECLSKASSDSLLKDKYPEISSNQINRFKQLEKFLPVITTGIKAVAPDVMEGGAAVAKTTPRVAASLASRVVGGALIVAAMGFDIADIISNAGKLKESYQPEAGRQILERTEELKNTLKELDNVNEKLKIL